MATRGHDGLSLLKGRAIFQKCDDPFLTQIKTVIKTSDSALILTRSNELFYIHKWAKTPVRVKSFSCAIKELFRSKEHFFVLSTDMKLFVSCFSTIYFWPIFADLTISQFSCGLHHAAILNPEGKIFSFSIGPKDLEKDLELCKTNATTKWSTVVCGDSFTASIDTDSKLYVWRPQLITHPLPMAPPASKMSSRSSILNNVKQVACGSNHILALTYSGKMFAVGFNDYGQLGLGNTTYRGVPELITSVTEKVFEIGSSLFQDISCCKTNTQKVYIWGNNVKEKLLVPTLVPNMTSLQAYYNTLEETTIKIVIKVPRSKKVLPKPVPSPPVQAVAEQQPSSTCWQDLLEDLIDQEGDFTICVQGRPIRVLKTILTQRSRYFQALSRNNWKENESGTMDVQYYTYELYMVYLRYLYSGKLNSSGDALELYGLADYYMEVELKQLCRDILLNNITANNALDIYKSALGYNEKILENGSLKYIKNNFCEMLKADSFKDDKDLLFDILNKITLKGQRSVRFE